MKFVSLIGHEHKTDLIIFFVLYSTSFFILLINCGIFWDDWVLYNMQPENVSDIFNQAGGTWGGYFHNFLLSIGNGITPYRILIFASYLLSSIFLYCILFTISEIGRFERLLVVIFFAILPVNSARIALINAPSAFCYFLFWLGFLFLSLYLKDKKIVFRIQALIFFFLSFAVSSLLVFYVIAMFYIAYIEFYKRTATFSPASIIKKVLCYSDFIILPVVYWIVKTIFVKATHLYAGYYTLTMAKLYGIPELLHLSFYTSFIEPLKQSFRLNSVISMIALGIIVFLLLKNKHSQKVDDKRFLFFYGGWFLFFLAVFPYNALGLYPHLNDWQSRHQLIIPLGVSLILVYGTRLLIPSETIQKILYSLLISSFILTNIIYYANFQKDWYKQVSLMENFKASEIIKGNTTFLFDDRIEELNANHRTYRYYEYAGQMKLVFGEETRFGHRKQDFDHIEKLLPSLNGNNNMKDYKMIQPQYIVEIHGNKKISKRDLIRLKYLELFAAEKFKEAASELTTLKYQKIVYQ